MKGGVEVCVCVCGSWDVLAGPQNFKGLVWKVRPGFKFEVGLL